MLPAGPHSILAVNTEEAPNYNLCGHNITIPTTITAQDGAVFEQTTNVTVTGCGGVKAYKATSAQLLAKALKACRHKYKKRSRRASALRAKRLPASATPSRPLRRRPPRPHAGTGGRVAAGASRSRRRLSLPSGAAPTAAFLTRVFLTVLRAPPA